MTEDELEIVKATWRAAFADVGTSTLAYRALSLVPRLFDEIDRLRKELDEALEGSAWRATLDDPSARERLRGL